MPSHVIDQNPSILAAPTGQSAGFRLMTSSPETGGRIPSLDGLRAFSIALVIISHAAINEHFTVDRHFTSRLALSILGNGHFGVQVFFVISGFIITHLLLKEHARTKTIDLKKFYLRRVFRICPAFYVLIAVVSCLSLANVFHATARDILYAATFTWLYNFHAWNWYLTHSWSLSVEEQFYVFWPATIILVGVRKIRYVAIGIILAVPCAHYLSLLVLPTSKMIHRVCYVITAGRFDLLMFGCVAAILWPSKRFQSLLHSSTTPWICAVLGLFAVAVSSAKEIIPNFNNHIVFASLADTAIGLGISAGMVGVVSRPRSTIGVLLNAKVIAWIGTLSYSIYLWQQLFLTPDPMNIFQRLPANVFLALAAGVASFYLIERPAIRFRVYISRDPTSSGPAL